MTILPTRKSDEITNYNYSSKILMQNYQRMRSSSEEQTAYSNHHLGWFEGQTRQGMGASQQTAERLRAIYFGHKG